MGIDLTRPTPGVATQGNSLILRAPKGVVADRANPKVTELAGATCEDVTYMITAGGFNHTPGNETITDERETLPYPMELDGNQTDTLEVTHAWDQNGVAGAKTGFEEGLVLGEEYDFFRRDGIPHDTPLAAGQRVKVFSGTARRTRDVPPVKNEIFKKITPFALAGETLDDVTIVAGP